MPNGTLSDRSEEIVAGYHQLGLAAMIGIGGDGSMAILRSLAQQGNFNLVAILKLLITTSASPSIPSVLTRQLTSPRKHWIDCTLLPAIAG